MEMDTAGVPMWEEVLLGIFVKKKTNGQAIFIWDSCGPHNVPSLKVITEIFASINAKCQNLPPNMTERLHVMDLVVKVPMKSGILSHRCE